MSNVTLPGVQHAAVVRSARAPRRRGAVDAIRHLRADGTSWSVVAVGAAMTIVVARDGTPVWQVVRFTIAVAVTSFAVWLLPRARAVVALGLGLVAIPVGVGIGGPWLTKTGLTPMALAGAASFAGGLVLMGVGFRSAVRSRPRWVSVAGGAAAVVALLVLSISLGQAVAATNVPRTAVGDRTPAELGLEFRDVALIASDGVRLDGWYLPSNTGAAVVLLHGAGSTRSSVLDHAAVLARRGYGVLLYDARGHGDSAGRAMDFGWFGDRDLRGAVDFLERRPDVDRGAIAAVGLSMGGEQAIGAAAALPELRAVVAEGATGRVGGDKAWLSDEFGVRGAITEAIGALTEGFTDLLTDAAPPITLHDAVAASAPRPMLLIAAEDVPDEGRAARYLERAAPETVELWVAPDSGHTDALGTDPEQWEARVVGFLDGALGLEGGVPSP